jgi:small conductance mechanosensitive channel
VALAVVWFFAGLLQRIGIHVIQRLADAWSSVRLRPQEDASRRARRIPTISRVLENIVSILIYLLAVAASLNVLGVPAASLLTAGALIAFAVTFAAQSVIKDVTGGMLILAEDQFAIGDYITVGGISGIVERLSLRATQVREDDGRLATIPNGLMSVVENATRDWARVTTTVDVAYDSDVERALSVIADAADALYHDPQWSAAILEPPRVLGIDAMSHAGISIRTAIRCVAAQRLFVRLEFNRRVRLALEAHGIAVGMPQQEFHSGAPEEGRAAEQGIDPPRDASPSPAGHTPPPR